MRKANYHKANKTYRFKKWSRLSYAVFNSLHLEVSIGFLNAYLSDQIGDKKKSNPISQPETLIPEKEENLLLDPEIESATICQFLVLYFFYILSLSQGGSYYSDSLKPFSHSPVADHSPSHLGYTLQFYRFSFPLFSLSNYFLNLILTDFESKEDIQLTNLYILNFIHDEEKNHRTNCAVSDHYVCCRCTEYQ